MIRGNASHTARSVRRSLRLAGLAISTAVAVAALPAPANGADRPPADARAAVGAAPDGGLTARAERLLRGELAAHPGAGPHAGTVPGISPSARVVGGRLTAIREVPWQVDVWSGSSRGYVDCGGSILGPTVILTAAHCVDNVNVGANPEGGGGVAIWAGISHLAPSQRSIGDQLQERLVTGVRIHPSYRPGVVASTGDLAVLTLASPLVLGLPTAQAIALAPPQQPIDGERPALGPDVLLSGYGLQTAGVDPSGALFSLATKLAPPDVCPDNGENALELCVRAPGGNACSGDSGGPLVLPGAVPLQIGVVSNGPVDCAPGAWSGYADVTVPEHRAFIDGAASPPLAPRQLQGIAIVWDKQGWPAGSGITCKGGAWSGSPSLKWKVSDDLGATLATGAGSELRYTLQKRDVGRRVSCRAFASNAGGVHTTAPVDIGPIAPYVAPPVPKVATLATPTRVKRGKAYAATVLFADLPSGINAGRAKLTVAGWKVIGGTTKYRPMAAGGGALSFKYRVPKKARRGKLVKLGVSVELTAAGQPAATVSRTIRVRVR